MICEGLSELVVFVFLEGTDAVEFQRCRQRLKERFELGIDEKVYLLGFILDLLVDVDIYEVLNYLRIQNVSWFLFL